MESGESFEPASNMGELFVSVSGFSAACAGFFNQPRRTRRPMGGALSHTASAMALPMSEVLALPPMSGVRGPVARTFSMAATTEAAASGQPR